MDGRESRVSALWLDGRFRRGGPSVAQLSFIGALGGNEMAKDLIIQNAHTKTRKNPRSIIRSLKRGPSTVRRSDWYLRAEAQISISRNKGSSILWSSRIDEDQEVN